MPSFFECEFKASYQMVFFDLGITSINPAIIGFTINVKTFEYFHKIWFF